jgi:hypothetical protein
MTNKISLPGKILFTCLLSFASCRKKDDNALKFWITQGKLNLLDTTDYFPLHLGNYWKIGSDLITIDSMKNINDTIYYRKVVPYGEWGNYRKTADGKVYTRSYIYGNNKQEVLNFDLVAPEGHTWSFTTTGDRWEKKWNATLISKNATVRVGDFLFKNCYKYYFDSPQWADEEHIMWLAPGIGLVKIASDGIESTYEGGRTLTNVQINGVEIDFR